MEKPINPVGWFEIYVKDLKRAQKFYQDILKVKMSPLPIENNQLEMIAFPMDEDSKNISGALVYVKNHQVEGNGTIVYFTCKDCAEEESRVKKAGGEVVQPKMLIGEYGFVSLVKDTEGNMIGLHSQN